MGVSDILEVLISSLHLSAWHHHVRIAGVSTKSLPWDGPPAAKHVNHEVAVSKVVHVGGVDGSSYQSLGWHVGGCTGARGHLRHTGGTQVEYFGDAEIRDLGAHVRRKQDIVGSEVAVDDRIGGTTMEVTQAHTNITKNRVAALIGEFAMAVDTRSEGGVQPLHEQHWDRRALVEVNPQELDDVRVTQPAQHLTLAFESPQHGLTLTRGCIVIQVFMNGLPNA